jgi:hypothetical protein
MKRAMPLKIPRQPNKGKEKISWFFTLAIQTRNKKKEKRKIFGIVLKFEA